MSEGTATEAMTDGESLDLPCDIDSVVEARRRLTDYLVATQAPEPLVRDAATVLSELLMNAIVHGSPDSAGNVQATWWRDEAGALTISVRDDGAGGTPRRQEPDEDDGGGRGLLLVERLSERWWSDARDGTVVAAVLTTTRPDSAEA